MRLYQALKIFNELHGRDLIVNRDICITSRPLTYSSKETYQLHQHHVLVHCSHISFNNSELESNIQNTSNTVFENRSEATQ